MSKKNGDKSRFGRLQQQKVHARELTRNLRKELMGKKPVPPANPTK